MAGGRRWLSGGGSPCLLPGALARGPPPQQPQYGWISTWVLVSPKVSTPMRPASICMIFSNLVSEAIQYLFCYTLFIRTVISQTRFKGRGIDTTCHGKNVKKWEEACLKNCQTILLRLCSNVSNNFLISKSSNFFIVLIPLNCGTCNFLKIYFSLYFHSYLLIVLITPLNSTPSL